MALFGTKKNTKAVVAKKERNPESVVPTQAPTLLRPRITEKATINAEVLNAYTFEVSKTATKRSIMQAVKEFYNVTPLRVNIINLPAKKIFARGKMGSQAGVKKAQILLKKGDKIEFV